MRLKPAGILIVVVIIAILAYFAVRPKLEEVRKENSAEINTTQGSRDTSTSSTTPSPETTAARTADREFNYIPEK
ncbi:MAG: hypothetical protein ACXWCG_07130, partial [Flavitalea sp.]